VTGRHKWVDLVKATSERRIRQGVLQKIADERGRQDEKFGDQIQKDLSKLFAILAEEFGEVSKEVCEWLHGDATPERLRKLEAELIQTAACCVVMLEYAERDGGWADACEAPIKSGNERLLRELDGPLVMETQITERCVRGPDGVMRPAPELEEGMQVEDYAEMDASSAALVGKLI
jgi:NTP pyrophosphatase (non-canonical NTP hydrolase)